MFLVVVAAILGAALSLFVRSALLAFALALTLTGGVQYGLIAVSDFMARRPENLPMVQTLQAVVGDDLTALLPTLAAAGGASLIAAFMLTLSRREKESDFWLPGQGGDKADHRRSMRADLIEERPIHVSAESRIDKILRR